MLPQSAHGSHLCRSHGCHWHCAFEPFDSRNLMCLSIGLALMCSCRKHVSNYELPLFSLVLQDAVTFTVQQGAEGVTVVDIAVYLRLFWWTIMNLLFLGLPLKWSYEVSFRMSAHCFNNQGINFCWPAIQPHRHVPTFGSLTTHSCQRGGAGGRAA